MKFKKFVLEFMDNFKQTRLNMKQLRRLRAMWLDEKFADLSNRL